jgi:hypothetical protein
MCTSWPSIQAGESAKTCFFAQSWPRTGDGAEAATAITSACTKSYTCREYTVRVRCAIAGVCDCLPQAHHMRLSAGVCLMATTGQHSLFGRPWATAVSCFCCDIYSNWRKWHADSPRHLCRGDCSCKGGCAVAATPTGPAEGRKAALSSTAQDLHSSSDTLPWLVAGSSEAPLLSGPLQAQHRRTLHAQHTATGTLLRHSPRCPACQPSSRYWVHLCMQCRTATACSAHCHHYTPAPQQACCSPGR